MPVHYIFITLSNQPGIQAHSDKDDIVSLSKGSSTSIKYILITGGAQMDTLSNDELKKLVEKQSERCDSVSIFMPTYKTGQEIKQNPSRLKNLITKAEKQLEALLPRAVEARRFLSPIEQLQSDELFWQHPSDGLAVFLSQNML